MPDSLGYRFLAEARRLLDLDFAAPTVTTVQASAIVNLTLNLNGIDEIGWWYLRMSVDMAKTLDLFSIPKDGDSEWRMVAIVTAWGLFNWQA